MTELETRAIQQVYTIAAPSEKVFEALTDPGVLNRWWTTRSASEPEAGGAYEYIWEFEDASRNGKQRGAYLDVTPNRKISYPWEAGDNKGEHNTIVHLTLNPEAGSTKLVLIHEGYPMGEGWEQVYEMTAQAWGFFLGNLKSFLEEGRDNRREALGQVIAS